jgi:hypothetical protein
MADFKLNWRGSQMLREVHKEIGNRLKTVSEIQISETQASISFQCDYIHHSTAPLGPYKESGELISSFKKNVDRKNLVATIWNTSAHALPLELGWNPPGNHAAVPARPFQRRVLARNIPRYGAILGTRIF